MAAYVLIHFERKDEEDGIALVGIYDKFHTAKQVMQALYNHELASDHEWELDLCVCDANNAVIQDEYHICHRWMIFNSDDAGIHLWFT